MSRTWKDRGYKKYRLGYCWISYANNKGTQRKRIERLDCQDGGMYKKIHIKLDDWHGM